MLEPRGLPTGSKRGCELRQHLSECLSLCAHHVNTQISGDDRMLIQCLDAAALIEITGDIQCFDAAALIQV